MRTGDETLPGFTLSWTAHQDTLKTKPTSGINKMSIWDPYYECPKCKSINLTVIGRINFKQAKHATWKKEENSAEFNENDTATCLDCGYIIHKLGEANTDDED